MVHVMTGTIEVDFADLVVPDDFLAARVVRRAVLDDSVDTRLDTAFGARRLFFRGHSPAVVRLFGDGLNDSSKVEAVLAAKKRDLEILWQC